MVVIIDEVDSVLIDNLAEIKLSKDKKFIIPSLKLNWLKHVKHIIGLTGSLNPLTSFVLGCFSQKASLTKNASKEI